MACIFYNKPCVFFGIVKRVIFSIVLEFRKRFPRPSFDTYFTMPQCCSDDFRTAPRKCMFLFIYLQKELYKIKNI